MSNPNPTGAASVTVQAEARACEALRSYLLLTLPNKVAAINAGRFASIVTSIPGPFATGGTLYIGDSIGEEVLVTIPDNSTSAEVATALGLAGVAVQATVDAYQRITFIAVGAPALSAASVVSISGEGTFNALLGIPRGGLKCVLAPITAPDAGGVYDGEPEIHDFGPGFILVLGDRTSAPRANIRSDINLVTLKVNLYAAEPNGNVDGSTEFGQQCLRAVRESLLEDRTLLGRVHLVELPSFHFTARTFRFAGQAVSGLYTASDMTLKIHVYERS